MTTLANWTELEVLFASYLAGDTTAARTLFSGFMPPLEGYFRARLGAGPDAEDLVQVTLLKIHFARDRFDRRQSLKTWVFTIASRTLIDHWRGSNEDIVSDHQQSADGAGDEGESLIDRTPSDLLSPEEKVRLHSDLNSALQTLKPTDRSIVYLYGVEGLSMAEIAEALGLTEGATKLRAHRAYREMRKQLDSN